MIDALNVIEGQDECRTFVRLNALSLTMTVGVIVFLLLAVGAVVAFPLVMSTFGLKDFTATATWLIRWPLLLALMIGALTVFYRFAPCRQGAPRGWFSPGAVIAALHLARGLGGAVVLSVELRRLQRNLWLARRRHRPDDVDVAVDHRRAARRAVR